MVGGFTIGSGIIAYYGALIIASGLINLRRIAKRISICSFALVFIMTAVGYSVYDYNCTHLYVVGGEKQTNLYSPKMWSGEKFVSDYTVKTEKIDDYNCQIAEAETELYDLMCFVSCPKCGTRMKKDCRYCPRCGEKR
jgi:hypothetical protein